MDDFGLNFDSSEYSQLDSSSAPDTSNVNDTSGNNFWSSFGTTLGNISASLIQGLNKPATMDPTTASLNASTGDFWSNLGTTLRQSAVQSFINTPLGQATVSDATQAQAQVLATNVTSSPWFWAAIVAVLAIIMVAITGRK